MKRKISKMCSLALSALLFFMMMTPAFAAFSPAPQPVVKCAYVPNVLPNGSNLLNETLDNNQFTNDAYADVNVTFNSNSVQLAGAAGGQPFSINAQYAAVNENGNVYIYQGEDSQNNFDVLYIAAEKEISKSLLYFNAYSRQNNFGTVLKLYLREKDTSNFVIIEIFGVAFPNIIAPFSASNGTSDEACLAQSWYGKVFEPAGTLRSEISTRAESTALLALEQYSYNSFGITIRHNLQYEYGWNISDVARNQIGNARMTLKITAKSISAPGYPNEESSTSSTLSLKNITLALATNSNVGLNVQRVGDSDDNVWRSGGITTSFSMGISVGKKGFSVSPSLSFTPYFSGNYQRNELTIDFDNYNGILTRNGETSLNSPYSLNAIGNKLGVTYQTQDYGGVATSGNMLLEWRFFVSNAMDYAAGHSTVKSKSVSVTVT